MMYCTLDSIITHLNNEHGWSREWIALEVVRPNEEQADVDDFPLRRSRITSYLEHNEDLTTLLRLGSGQK